ncbi:hypothetical protein [Nocardia miyunensis]|uniref:hypothetical protein n=1 Tax=Nocardia miyunensis TaxID=282684 RepID=UPI0012F50E20|nr:hypothetical protein [Nocardia miyunensis]
MQLIAAARRSRLPSVVLAVFVTIVVCASCKMRLPTTADHHLDGVSVRGYTEIGDSPQDAGGSSDSITGATKYYIGPVISGDVRSVVTAGDVILEPPKQPVVLSDTTLIAIGNWPDKDDCVLIVDRWTSAPDSSWKLSAQQRDELRTGKAEAVKIAVTCGG